MKYDWRNCLALASRQRNETVTPKTDSKKNSFLAGHSVCPNDGQGAECNAPPTALDHFIGHAVSREPLTAEAGV